MSAVATLPGLVRLPLQVFEDPRGGFVEVRRASLLPRATVQTNVSFSRRRVIRGRRAIRRASSAQAMTTPQNGTLLAKVTTASSTPSNEP